MTDMPDGNDFQFKAKKTLVSNGWTVRMSPHYNDAFSEKPREIDIIAEKAFPPSANTIYNATVIVRLFIECKYISERTVFWFDNRNLEEAKKVVDSTRSFHEADKNTEVTRNHHYLFDTLIAKLFRTGGKVGTDGDPIHKAINQCLNAYIYFRHHSTNLRKTYDHQTVVELDYPLIVCNSFDYLFKKDMTTEDQEGISSQPIKESFQLEIDYAYTSKDQQLEEVFYIDLLSIDGLTNFEENVLSLEINLAKQKANNDRREAEYYRRQHENNDDYDIFNPI